MSEKHGAHKGLWLSAPAGSSEDLAQRALSQSAKRRSEGAWTEASEAHVAKLPLLFSPARFSTSKTRLETLRSLCQVYDVRFKKEVAPSHRKFVGPIITGIKKAVMPFISVVFGPLFYQQASFNSAVVRLLGDLANEKHNLETVE